MVVSEMKLVRTKLGIRQVDLWLKTGIPQWRISLIERGLPPKPDEVERIAHALGVEQTELFRGGEATNA